MMKLDERAIELTFGGRTHAGVNAVISTQELRERLKPFVFLDHFDMRRDEPWGFPFHPHSGVATFTYTQAAELHHEDTGGHRGTLGVGGVQWMAAGGGIWHEEVYRPQAGRVAGLQLWMTLPPELENGPVAYQGAEPGELPRVGNTTVLAGVLDGHTSPLVTPYPFNYFDVALEVDQAWSFSPPQDHDVAWVYAHRGSLRVGDEVIPPRHLVVFTRGPGSLRIRAHEGPAGFVVGTAPQSPHPLVIGRFSMHTSEDALADGLAQVRTLGRRLQAEGRI